MSTRDPASSSRNRLRRGSVMTIPPERVRPPSSLDALLRGHHLDAVVAQVSDVEPSLPVYGHALGQSKLTGRRALAPPLHQGLSSRGQLLHSIIETVGHVDIAQRIERQADRRVKLTRIRALASPLS